MTLLYYHMYGYLYFLFYQVGGTKYRSRTRGEFLFDSSSFLSLFSFLSSSLKVLWCCVVTIALIIKSFEDMLSFVRSFIYHKNNNNNINTVVCINNNNKNKIIFCFCFVSVVVLLLYFYCCCWYHYYFLLLLLLLFIIILLLLYNNIFLC